MAKMGIDKESPISSIEGCIGFSTEGRDTGTESDDAVLAPVLLGKRSTDIAYLAAAKEECTFFSPAVDKKDKSDNRGCLYSDQSGSLVFASSILAARSGFKIKEKKWR